MIISQWRWMETTRCEQAKAEGSIVWQKPKTECVQSSFCWLHLLPPYMVELIVKVCHWAISFHINFLSSHSFNTRFRAQRLLLWVSFSSFELNMIWFRQTEEITVHLIGAELDVTRAGKVALYTHFIDNHRIPTPKNILWTQVALYFRVSRQTWIICCESLKGFNKRYQVSLLVKWKLSLYWHVYLEWEII